MKACKMKCLLQCNPNKFDSAARCLDDMTDRDHISLFYCLYRCISAGFIGLLLTLQITKQSLSCFTAILTFYDFCFNVMKYLDLGYALARGWMDFSKTNNVLTCQQNFQVTRLSVKVI